MNKNLKKIVFVAIVVVVVYLSIFLVLSLINKGNLKNQSININNANDTAISNALKKDKEISNPTNSDKNIDIKKSAIEYNENYSSKFSPKIGNPEGRVSVVMFVDFECPFCNKEYRILKSVMEKYKDVGYFEFRNMPITSLHPNAQQIANVAMCANAQGKFWEMHNELFDKYNDRQGVYDESELIKIYYNYGKDVGLDMNKFAECYDKKSFDGVVKKDILDALSYGVDSTPTFFINGNKTQGVLSGSNWDEIFKISIEKSK